MHAAVRAQTATAAPADGARDSALAIAEPAAAAAAAVEAAEAAQAAAIVAITGAGETGDATVGGMGPTRDGLRAREPGAGGAATVTRTEMRTKGEEGATRRKTAVKVGGMVPAQAALVPEEEIGIVTAVTGSGRGTESEGGTRAMTRGSHCASRAIGGRAGSSRHAMEGLRGIVCPARTIAGTGVAEVVAGATAGAAAQVGVLTVDRAAAAGGEREGQARRSKIPKVTAEGTREARGVRGPTVSTATVTATVITASGDAVTGLEGGLLLVLATLRHLHRRRVGRGAGEREESRLTAGGMGQRRTGAEQSEAHRGWSAVVSAVGGGQGQRLLRQRWRLRRLPKRPNLRLRERGVPFLLCFTCCCLRCDVPCTKGQQWRTGKILFCLEILFPMTACTKKKQQGVF